MLAKRIIPCLDVKDGKVVKGIQFENHRIVGDILELAEYYSASGCDELVFYDITASCDQRAVSRDWICRVAQVIDIPFCVAGGIRTLQDAEIILNAGADKISINSPALEDPNLINRMTEIFGQQCIVVGIDSREVNGEYVVCQYTGDSTKRQQLSLQTIDWVSEVQQRGAGEIVLNCMNQDGMRKGYDIKQLSLIRAHTTLPLIASGGAGSLEDFSEVFNVAHVDGALAASVFHNGTIKIPDLKKFLLNEGIRVRGI
ncbi:MAG: imidazole glycerol phosphate synthase subunit HisF [Gammaproteobacteria bacterium]